MGYSWDFLSRGYSPWDIPGIVRGKLPQVYPWHTIPGIFLGLSIPGILSLGYPWDSARENYPRYIPGILSLGYSWDFLSRGYYPWGIPGIVREKTIPGISLGYISLGYPVEICPGDILGIYPTYIPRYSYTWDIPGTYPRDIPCVGISPGIPGEIYCDVILPWSFGMKKSELAQYYACLLYTSPSPRDKRQSRMPSSA